MKHTLQTTIGLDLRSQVMNSARSYIAKHLVNTVDSRFLYNMFIFGELNNILEISKQRIEQTTNENNKKSRTGCLTVIVIVLALALLFKYLTS